MTITVVPLTDEEKEVRNYQDPNLKKAKVFDAMIGVGTISFSVLDAGTVLIHQFGIFTDPDIQQKIQENLSDHYVNRIAVKA